ncbi:MAG TPA: DUF2306 domain-containing protein [Caulobacteraceae bacterium]|jgi:uncharacterized membrane protein|nr:DUF2306 domain-containing protein [Caulobacteraceae bacterium]
MKLDRIWLWTATVLAAAIALSSYRYLLPGMPGGAPSIVANHFTRTGALLLHAGVSATALILGALQFYPGLRARWPAWHRRAGTLYVIFCLLGGCAALLLAAGTTAGLPATAGFGLLGLSWLGCTAQAWRFARARDFVRHRRWMTRSYALTFAAVTLRLYLPVAYMTHLDITPSYQAISFLCWIPNLIVAELWLRVSAGVRTSPPLATAAQNPG